MAKVVSHILGLRVSPEWKWSRAHHWTSTIHRFSALEAVGTVQKVTSLDSDQIKRELRTRVADVKALLGRRKPQARQMLRKLLTRIEMTPVIEDGRRGYRLVADGSFEKLFSGTVLEALPPTVVAPTGFGIQTCSLLSHSRD